MTVDWPHSVFFLLVNTYIENKPTITNARALGTRQCIFEDVVIFLSKVITHVIIDYKLVLVLTKIMRWAINGGSIASSFHGCFGYLIH